jgi:monooxygenase
MKSPISPDWKGVSDYKGQFIHAQLWDPKID